MMKPVEISLEAVVVRIVPQSLRPQRRGVQPIRKLQEKIFAALQLRDCFMIPNAHKKWNGTERRNLAIDEIRPLDVSVFGNRKRFRDVLVPMLDVFIKAGGLA